MNTTKSRAEINRENAQHSTGPRTEEGKKRASLSALRHGLTGQTIVMPYEDLNAYKEHTAKAFAALKPVGYLEEQAAQTISDCHWRLNRGRAIENNLLAIGQDQYADAYNIENPQAHAAITTARGARDITKQLANMSIYEQRLSRQLKDAKAEIKQLQADREKHERNQMYDAIPMRKLFLAKKIDWHPPVDGFDFTLPQIDAVILREQRILAAHEFVRTAAA